MRSSIQFGGLLVALSLYATAQALAEPAQIFTNVSSAKEKKMIYDTVHQARIYAPNLVKILKYDGEALLGEPTKTQVDIYKMSDLGPEKTFSTQFLGEPNRPALLQIFSEYAVKHSVKDAELATRP